MSERKREWERMRIASSHHHHCRRRRHHHRNRQRNTRKNPHSISWANAYTIRRVYVHILTERQSFCIYVCDFDSMLFFVPKKNRLENTIEATTIAATTKQKQTNRKEEKLWMNGSSRFIVWMKHYLLILVDATVPDSYTAVANLWFSTDLSAVQ